MALKVEGEIFNLTRGPFEKTNDRNGRDSRAARNGQLNQNFYEYGSRRGRRQAARRGISYTDDARELPGHLRRSDLNEIENWYSQRGLYQNERGGGG